MTTEQMERTYGLRISGSSGDWTATSSDCEGWGRTRMDAIRAALKDRRDQRDDADRLDRESGTRRDRYGFPILD